MSNLTTFIDEVIAVIRTVQGVKQAGGNPDKLSAWPAAPVYTVSGRANGELGNLAAYRHDVRIGLLGPYGNDNSKITAALLPILEPLVEALIAKMLAHGFTGLDHFGDIDYVFGPIDWAGQIKFGFLLTIYDVTIKRAMT